MALKTYLQIFVLITVFLFLPLGITNWTKGFKIQKLLVPIENHKKWTAVSQLTEPDLKKIFDQKFYYLNKGLQSYVFMSEDRQYVIKFFGSDRACFLENDSSSMKLKKFENLLTSCSLAFNKAQEETALIDVHLNISANRLPVLKAYGPRNEFLDIPLDLCRFAVQKRVDNFEESFRAALKENDTRAIQTKIDSFLALTSRRIEKGICNKDPSLKRNFGFIGNDAVEIDFGSYEEISMDEGSEKLRYQNKLRVFFKKSAPQWVQYLDAKDFHE